MDKYIKLEELIECAEHTSEFMQHMASVYDLESLVAGMRSCDVAPVRHGKWIEHGSKWKCTNCGVLLNIDGTPAENVLRFCPNCGAKMDGGDMNG